MNIKRLPTKPSAANPSREATPSTMRLPREQYSDSRASTCSLSKHESKQERHQSENPQRVSRRSPSMPACSRCHASKGDRAKKLIRLQKSSPRSMPPEWGHLLNKHHNTKTIAPKPSAPVMTQRTNKKNKAHESTRPTPPAQTPYRPHTS